MTIHPIVVKILKSKPKKGNLKVSRICGMGTMNVHTTLCANSSCRYWDILLKRWRIWPSGGNRRSQGIIKVSMIHSWKCCIAIHPMVLAEKRKKCLFSCNVFSIDPSLHFLPIYPDQGSSSRSILDPRCPFLGNFLPLFLDDPWGFDLIPLAFIRSALGFSPSPSNNPWTPPHMNPRVLIIGATWLPLCTMIRSDFQLLVQSILWPGVSDIIAPWHPLGSVWDDPGFQLTPT